MYKVKASFPLPLREDWTDASLTILKPFHIEVAALEDVKALYNTQASLKLCLISQACELIQCKERQCRVILVNNIFLCIHFLVLKLLTELSWLSSFCLSACWTIAEVNGRAACRLPGSSPLSKQSLLHLQILWYHESFTVRLLSSCKQDQRQHVIILFYFGLLSGCCHLFLFWLIVCCTLNVISHSVSQFGSTLSVWYMTHLSIFSYQYGILYDICDSAKLIVISHAARSSTNALFSRFLLRLHILHFLSM